MNKKQRIDWLIANGKASEDDRETLQGMSERFFIALNAKKDQAAEDASDPEGEVQDSSLEETPPGKERNAGKDLHSFDGDTVQAGAAQAGGKGTKEEYSKNSLSDKETEDYLRKAPKHLRSVFNRLRDQDRQDRINMITKLVANIADTKQRNDIGNRYLNTKSTEELQELLLLTGNNLQRPERDAAPSYFGAAVPATFNEQSAEERADILEIPTINWAEERPDVVANMERAAGRTPRSAS